MISALRFAGLGLALLLVGLFDATSAKAQPMQSGSFRVGSIHRGLVVGAIVGVAAVAGAGITYLVLHKRGVVVGCIADFGGKRTLVGSDKKVYSLVEAIPSPPVGEQAKLKGYKSGPASAPSFRVVKVLKDFGPCRP